MLTLFNDKWQRKTMNVPRVKMDIHPETGKLTNYWLEPRIDTAHKIIENIALIISLSKHSSKINSLGILL